MAQQPSTTLADATDGTDLIPGNQRGVTAINDALGAGAASVADTAAALARTATSLMWSGPAADAFSEHRRAVIEHTDLMDEAVDTVRTALDGHLDALTSAQGTAGDALDLWHTAEQQMRVAKQYDTPEAQQAANAEAVRAQAVAAARATAKRARALLNQATQNLTQSGDRAETTVRAALEALRNAHLPTLDLNAATAAATPAAESTRTTQTAAPTSLAWTPPGWSGPTTTVQPPADNVHDSLSRIAKRLLGDANRWPEIYQLNVGQPVGPHAVLTDPSLIQPGWVLRLPSPTALISPLETPQPAQPTVPAVPAAPVIHHPISTSPHADTVALAPVSGPPPLAHPVPPTAAPGTPEPGVQSGPATPPPMSTVGPPDTTAPTTPAVPPSGPLTPALPPATPQPHPGHTPATPVPLTGPGGGLTTASGDRGVNAGDGLIVAGGVAAALVVGVGAVAGIRHLRSRSNGSPLDTSVPAEVASHGTAPEQQDHGAPVIRRLTAAMPPTDNGTSSDGNNGHGNNGPDSTAPWPGFPSGPDSIWMDGAGPARLPFGQRDGKTVLYDVAATLGLGLAGPGALNTARALLLSAVSAHPDARVVLSTYDRRRLLGDDYLAAGYPDPASARPSIGPDAGPVAPARATDEGPVRIERNLDGVLNEVEADIVTRFRVLEESAGQVSVPPLVVITTVPADTRRLQMIADLGAGLGVVVIILGGWPAGITCYVTRDGRVTDARGPGADTWDLDGLTLFSAGPSDTGELLTLLSSAPASNRPTGTRVRRGSVSRAATRGSDSDIPVVRGSLPATRHPAQPHHGVRRGEGTTQTATPAVRNQPTDGHGPIEHGVDHRAGNPPENHAEATDANRPEDTASVLDEHSEVARRLNPDSSQPAPPSGIARRLTLEPDDPVTPAPSPDADITGDAGAQTGEHIATDSDPHIPGGSTTGTVIVGEQVPHPRPADHPQRPVTSTAASPSAAGRAAWPTAEQNPPATASPAGKSVSAEPVLELQVLGSFRLRWRQDTDGEPDVSSRNDIKDITEALGPRPRELLTFIALHEDGVRRDEVVDALWPDANPARHTHALNAATSRLRRALGRATADRVTDLIRHTDHRLHLDDRLVTVDLWQFRAAWDAARRSTTDADRMNAYRAMIDAYHGALGQDVDADWVATPRQSLHRAATDATRNLADLTVKIDPQQTLDLLDSARNWDPYNEHLYRDIMRLQAKLGQVDAIRRTFDLLAARLAEINVKPTREARELLAGLEQRASHAGDLGPTSSSRSTGPRPPTAAPSRHGEHPSDQRRPASP